MKTLRLVFLIFICNISISKGQYYEWAKSFPCHRGYVIYGICSDVANNTFMTSKATYSNVTGGKAEIRKFDSTGTGVWSWELPAGGYEKLNISNITTDFAGNSYVTIGNPGTMVPVKMDSNLTISYVHFILKISPIGAILRVDSLPANQNFSSIIADSAGNLYLSDGFQTRKINKYGTLVWINPLVGGSKLALSNNKRLYVFGNTSYSLNTAGITQWAKQINGNDVAVDKAGNIYLTTNDSIYKLNSSGNLLWSNTIYHGQAISVDPSGKVYLADGSNILKLNNNGSLLKWTMGSLNTDIQKISATNQSCFVAGGYDALNETSFCPFHFTKLGGFTQSYSNWSFLTKINQSANMPFQAGIYTPSIYDNFLCAGISHFIPFGVCTNSNSAFGVNNEFRAQLSNTAGNFDSNIVDLGLAASAFIPLTVPKGNNYRVRVVSTDPVIIGDPNSLNWGIGNLTIDPITAKITNVSPVSLCSGDTITLNALVADPLSNYYWYLNDSINPVGYGDKLEVRVPGEYRLLVRDSYHFDCKIYSDSVIVNSYPKPSASIIASGPLSFCNGDSVIFTTSGGNFYQWKKNNTNIAGATFQNYTAKTAGNYKVKVSNSFGCTKISTAKTVSIICKEDISQPIKEYEIYTQQNQLPFTNKSSNAMKIALYNMNGEIVGRLNLVPAGSEYTYYLQNSGMYLLRIIEKSNVYWEKVIAGK